MKAQLRRFMGISADSNIKFNPVNLGRDVCTLAGIDLTKPYDLYTLMAYCQYIANLGGLS